MVSKITLNNTAHEASQDGTSLPAEVKRRRVMRVQFPLATLLTLI